MQHGVLPELRRVEYQPRRIKVGDLD